MQTILTNFLAALRNPPRRQSLTARIVNSAAIGGIVAAVVSALLSAAQGALSDVTSLWIPGLVLAAAGILVGGFIGAMTTVGREGPLLDAPDAAGLIRVRAVVKAA